MAVPEVLGLSRAAAEDAVRTAGLRLMVLEENAEIQDQVGLVLRVNPDAGPPRPTNTLVMVWVGEAQSSLSHHRHCARATRAKSSAP